MSSRSRLKEQTRQKILFHAARLFRKKGFAATGIDEVMAKAGLTAGGFYHHFKSKEDLLTQCLAAAFEQSRVALFEGVEGLSPNKKAQVLRGRYLSAKHRDHPERGCPLVGIAAELCRHGDSRKVTAKHLERLIGDFEAFTGSRTRAIRAISIAVGALLLSRLVKGESLSDEILRGARGPIRSNARRLS